MVTAPLTSPSLFLYTSALPPPSLPPPPLLLCVQVFVETLDHCFENVCELDLIFHVDRVHNILQEICVGGMVLETSMSEIITHVDAQNKLEKSESSAATTLRVRERERECFHGFT